MPGLSEREFPDCLVFPDFPDFPDNFTFSVPDFLNFLYSYSFIPISHSIFPLPGRNTSSGPFLDKKS